MGKVDEKYMEQALDLAEKGGGYVNPNPQVGAVIVNQGEVVGTGYHEKFGGPHAEVNALDEAGENAEDATMYVTLEPCVHHGKTPPCADKIIESGISSVHVAIKDPNPKVSGKGITKMQRAGIEVRLGSLADKARKVNEIFLHYTRTGRPFVLLKLAMTFDGKIATKTGDSRWITSEPSRKRVHELRARYSGVAVGVGTVISDDPRLNVRHADGPDGGRFVLDPSGRTPPDSRLLEMESDAPTVLVVGESLPEEAAAAFEEAGATVWRVPEVDRGLDLEEFLERMGDAGYDSLIVEGGSELAGSLVDHRLVDKINFFYAPKVIGGREAVPAVGGEGALKVPEGIKIKKLEFARTGDDLSVTGYPVIE
ncbi:bifunctional diaminohydroxyphosphoribosylaminopyrimidine deaminase/5-amino-6-(5-phosphoribosylamino)uracil reductase RibD [Candidatus Bipolaricaulota bacterium]|nr:bifunctional diaminohydroxyphosphoribosylaminopyrimidine deaminase/5-amino-6-(5-phosphoribosylamino)uracil reductase RibD [Candidatus Bipolaricaulota bacterium]